MFSSDACCFRNRQLRQLNDGEGWGKRKHFIQAKTLEKNSCKPNENKKKTQENPTPYAFIYHFSPKGYPFHIPSISDKWYPFHLPCLELCIPFDCCKSVHCFFTQKSIPKIACTQTLFYFFLFVPTPLHWRSVNPLRFIFYHPRSTDFEKEIEGL